MLKGLRALLLLLLVSTSAQAQSAPALRWDKHGRPDVVPGVTLPEAGAWVGDCQANGTGKVCSTVTAPVHRLEDANGDAPAETCETHRQDFGLELSQPDPGNHVCATGIDAGYRPTYTEIEASAFSLTTSIPGTLGAVYTEGAGYAQNTIDGYARVQGVRFPFKCTGLTLNGSIAYCSLFGGAATTTQDDAEALPGLACTHIRSISTTWLDTTGATRSALPGGCSVTIGRSLDNANSGTLATVPAATASLKQTVSTATSWADTNEVSMWVNSSGCSGATRGLAGVVTCD